MKKVLPLALLLFFSQYFLESCDDLEIDPKIELTDCLNEADKKNYRLLVENETEAGNLMASADYNPDNKITGADRPIERLAALAEIHDGLRRGFNCQYWGSDTKLLEGILSLDESEKDLFLLEPENFKSLFKITSDEVKKAIGQDDWIKEEVYVFPGISRVPWLDASETSKNQVIDHINKEYNEIRKLAGKSGDAVLFNYTDFLFPHATYHQVFCDRFVLAMGNPANTQVRNVLNSMMPIEKEIIEKFVLRAPKEIE